MPEQTLSAPTSGTPFAELLDPFPVGEFFRHHRDREFLLVDRDEPDRYADLLDLATVERFVFEGNPRKRHLQVLREGGGVDHSEYLYPSGLVDTVAVARLFAEGCSVVLPQAQEHLVSLGVLVRGLEAELGCRIQANVYLAPPSTSAFAPHYDQHDVFAVQVHGAKDWTLFDSDLPIPAPRAFDRVNDCPGREVAAFTLRQGSVCYIPRGRMHKALSDSVSVHVTVGVHWVTALDLLEATVQHAAQVVPSLQQALPHRWFESGEPQAEALAALRSVLPGLVSDQEAAAVLQGLHHDLVATRQPLVPGQLEQVLRIDEIDQGTVVARRDPMLWRRVDGDDTVEVACFGNVISFPTIVGAALSVLLAGADVRVGDLPGLDEEERLVLVRRLVREGVLQARW